MNRFIYSLSATLASIWLFVVSVPSLAGEAQRVDMTGEVKSKQGVPIPNAAVIVIAAGPRQGSSPLCPYSYPDCGKRATTDAGGNFRIASLDPALDFCIRILAPSYAPFTNSQILPESGPVQVTLDVRDLSQIPQERHVQARIIGPDGGPVSGATVDVDGEEKGDTTHWGGIDVDGMTMTDTEGEFHIGGPKPFTAIHVIIEAPGLAKRWARLEPGKMGLLRMTEGVKVTGRLLHKGQPLANLKLGISTVERRCGVFLSGFEATTEKDGRFVFTNIPLGMKFQVFSIMESAKTADASFRREFDSGNNDEAIDLGEIQAPPAYRISGKVVLADGKSVPPKTRLLLSREQAWDTALVQLNQDGTFTFDGVPEEQITLSFSVAGYRLSEKNPSLDSDHRGLIGRVSGNITNLTIQLEPGKPLGSDEFERLSYEEQKKRNAMPLRGAQ